MKHLREQRFVLATGMAALIHSTWSLGTFFGGLQPEGWHLIGWIIPAFLIAFALDVGQIATSQEIRRHGMTLARGVTFLIFALATYYLQWLYIAHHIPVLELSPGISPTMRDTALALRDLAIWIIPAFLPLSTILYTFSTPITSEETNAPTHPIAELDVSEPEPTFYELPETPLLEYEHSSNRILDAFLSREGERSRDVFDTTKTTRRSKKPIEIENYKSD